MASPRVLHIVDPGVFADPSSGGPCTLRSATDVIAHLPQFEHDVLVLGTRRDVQLARGCGLNVSGAFSPPQLLPLGGRNGLLRAISQLQHAGSHSVVHGWSPRAAMFAAVAMPNMPRVCTVDVKLAVGFDHRALRTLLTQHQSTVTASNAVVRDACRAADLPVGRMTITHPGVNPNAIDAAERAALRQRWGVDDDTMVIAALCEPASASDARIAVRVITSLALTGRNVRMVVPGGVLRRLDAKWWSKRLRKEHLLIFDDLATQPWRIAAGLDAAWIIAAVAGAKVRSASSLPLLWAMAAALPAVVEGAGAATSMIDDQRNGLLVTPGQAPMILDRLAHLYDDRQWAGELGQAARHWASEHASIDRYASQLADLYSN